MHSGIPFPAHTDGRDYAGADRSAGKLRARDRNSRQAQVGTGLGLPGRRHQRGGAGGTEPGPPYRHGIAGRLSGTDGSAEPDTSGVCKCAGRSDGAM